MRQQKRSSNPWSAWLVPSVLTASFVFLLQLLGLFRSLDEMAYDLAMRVSCRTSLGPAGVLLIYGDPSATADATDLPALLEQLNSLNPAHVAVVVPVSNELRQQLADNPHVTVGTRVVRDASDPARCRVAESTTSGDGITAAVVLPVARQGLYRKQVEGVLVDDKWIPTLESAVADRLGALARSAEEFRVHFRGGAGSLPHLTLDAALSGGLVPELVAGRVVLIGAVLDATQLGMATPTTGRYDKMPQLEFHGHALNTLLNGSAVWNTPPAVNWLIYVLVAMTAGLLFERASAPDRGPVLLALITVTAIGGFLILWLAHGWMPLVETAAVQVVCLGRTAQSRNAFTETAWQRLVEDLTARLRRRRWPTGFFSAVEPWSQIVSFLHQTLNLQRVIILELPPKKYHVREIESLNCSLSEIAEQRRDCRRWPYAGAVEAKRPINLTGSRPFLQLLANEEQYLVPLIFASELFGFVAVGVDRDEIQDVSDFEQRLEDFGDQIAELLYRRRCVLAEEKKEGVWTNMFAEAPEARIYAELMHATHLLERRMARLENIFDKSPTAAAIYDLFGRLMMVNARMSRLLQNEGVVASELTTIDLVVTLTRRDARAVRRLLRRVITGKRAESIPVSLGQQKGEYLLNVRPMELEVPQANVMMDATTPLHLQGILCELVDRTDVVHAFRLKEQLSESLGNTLRNDLAAVDLAASLVVEDDLENAQRREYGEVIHRKVEDAVATLEECEGFMAAELSGDDECLPISPMPAIEEATAVVQAAAEDRGVSIKILPAPLTSRIIAAPKLLPQVLDAVFEFLLLDARDDSEIKVGLEEGPAEVYLSFQNDGFGTEIDTVREVLFQESHTDIPANQRLREALDVLRNWGGQMTVASEIGRGTVINLVLRKFH
jgi:CHASE2 domain-containing sensor protein